MSSFREPHELHRRRLGRNIGLGLTLAGFIVIVFALTVVKVTRGDPMQGFDHTARPEMTPPETSQPIEGAAP